MVYRAGMPVPGPAGDTLAGAVDHRPALPPQVLDRAVDAFTTALHVTAVASAALVLLTAVLLIALLHHVPADPTTGAGVDSSRRRAAEPVPDDAAEAAPRT